MGQEDACAELENLAEWAANRPSIPAIQRELAILRAIREWAIAALDPGYTVGDEVEICAMEPSTGQRDSGWWRYREALAPGQCGIVQRIDYSLTRKTWVAEVAMPKTWTVHTESFGEDETHEVRYWNGPAREMPEGMVQPISYPDGIPRVFAFETTWVRKVGDGRTRTHGDTPTGGDCPLCKELQ